MQRATVLPALLLLGACAPYGTIATPAGADRLRAAWHLETEEDGHSVMLLVLANSPLPCGLPEGASTSDVEDLALDYNYAISREGARITAHKLYSSISGWEGRYPVQASVDPAALDAVEPRASEALYLGINEAEAQESHGLYRQYEARDADLVYEVEAPGEVVVEEEDDEALEGTFSLDSLDVSGTFHTTGCGSVDQVFSWIGILAP